MANNQNPRLATPAASPELIATLASASGGDNQKLDAILSLLGARLAREEKLIADEEETQRNMRRQNAQAMEAKRQDDIRKQDMCDHLTEHRDRASIAGQKSHSGNYLLLCSKCSRLWTDVNAVPPHLQNMIRWDWIGGPA